MTAALNEEQQALLELVTRRDLEWREAKRTAAEAARAMAARQIEHKRYMLDTAVRLAVEAGLPLVELRRKDQGLHTTNKSTVLESLARTLELAA